MRPVPAPQLLRCATTTPQRDRYYDTTTKSSSPSGKAHAVSQTPNTMAPAVCILKPPNGTHNCRPGWRTCWVRIPSAAHCSTLALAQSCILRATAEGASSSSKSSALQLSSTLCLRDKDGEDGLVTGDSSYLRIGQHQSNSTLSNSQDLIFVSIFLNGSQRTSGTYLLPSFGHAWFDSPGKSIMVHNN